MSTKKVPCTASPAGAPWTSFVAAVDEVARTPPGGYSRISGVQIPGHGCPVSGKFPDTVFLDSSLLQSLKPDGRRNGEGTVSQGDWLDLRRELCYAY